MSIRCGCSDQGDERVFGPCRACDPEPETPRRSRLIDLPRLIPSWVFVAPPEPTEERPGLTTAIRFHRQHLPPPEATTDDLRLFQPEPPCPVVHVELREQPWETVLSDDTEPGDLG